MLTKVRNGSKNNLLSKEYGKSENTGRLQDKMVKFKEQLNKLKESDAPNIEKDVSQAMKRLS